ncbi:hypothetical protein CWT12_07555 [Actinomyces sp. 432]|nr:hypothetical protein CWT12_07555 [Actinomyces sp. 432]
MSTAPGTRCAVRADRVFSSDQEYDGLWALRTGLEGCFRTWGMAVVPRDLIVRMVDVTKAKYSEEFREQVAREVVDKERSIASVAASYGLVAQTVGNWVAKYRKQHAGAREQKEATDAEELARLKAENYKLRMENEFLKKAAAFFAKEQE